MDHLHAPHAPHATGARGLHTARRQLLASVLVAAGLAWAGPAAAQTPLTDGEVRKVDREAGKLTLRHARIQHLDMPAMSMVFRVSEPKLLDGLKEGDRIRFAAERVNGQFTVTAVEAAK
jgi:Cu/Ag efflux protein CusF